LLTAGIGSGISGVSSLVGGGKGSKAAQKAAEIQSQNAQKVAGMATTAANNAATGVNAAVAPATAAVANATGTANAGLQNVFGSEAANIQPYLAAGSQGAGTLAQFLSAGGDLSQRYAAQVPQFSFDPSNIQNDPGYQFQMDQGMKAVQASAAAHGTLNSGGTLKDLTNYAQGLAGTEYGNAYNRALQGYQANLQGFQANLGGTNSYLQALQGLTGVGQNATAQYQNAAQNFGNLSGQNTINSGTFGANLINQAAQYSGNTGIQAAQIAGNALTGGANAQAAGVVGSANAWNSALGNVANTATGLGTLGYLQNGGGGYGGPSWNSQVNAAGQYGMSPTGGGYFPGGVVGGGSFVGPQPPPTPAPAYSGWNDGL
jgi:hypothetical protein